MYPFDNQPDCPVISRFVPPWDTSGWYVVRQNFAIGKSIYTNTPAVVVKANDLYIGAEYIATFDSYAEGFDDKQEVLFSVECPTIIYVALDQNAAPEFLDGFSANGDTLSASNGCTYQVFQRAYAEGEQVAVPGFRGNCHNYFVLAKPIVSLSQRKSFPTVKAQGFPAPYKRRSYHWYYREVFSFLPPDSLPVGFLCTGNCWVERYTTHSQRKYLHMETGATISHSQFASGYELFEMSLCVVLGSAEVTFAGTSIIISRYKSSLADGVFHLRFFRSRGECEIWINNRKHSVQPCRDDKEADFRLAVGNESIVDVDWISLRDQTEIYAVNYDFSDLPDHTFSLDKEGYEIIAFPSEVNHSLSLTNNAVCFAVPSITGPATIEALVQPRTSAFTLLSELRDTGGKVMLRVAMFKNNLFASNGIQWKRIFAGDNDWMYYPAGNWYRIKLRVDFDYGKYDLFIDGARRANGLVLANNDMPIAQIGFSAPNGQLFLNELQVYDALTISRGLIPPGPVFDVTADSY